MSADEIFLTNSLIELLPVTTLDRRAIGNGRPGEITKLLHVSYQKEVIKEVLAG
jgi:branched-chain amino acid aminotransferase